MHPRQIEAGGRQAGLFLVLVALFLLVAGIRTIASWVIDYQWWKEMHQVPTWVGLILYRVTPVLVAAVAAFLLFFTAHARGMKFAGVRLRDYPLYAKVSTVICLLLAAFVALATIDSWTVVRFFGGLQLGADSSAWRDPVFSKPLSFFFFSLPFYALLLRVLLALLAIAGAIYYLTARGWQLRYRLPELRETAEFDLRDLRLEGAIESRFLRAMVVVFLLGLAVHFWLGRYNFLFSDHAFLVGLDYVNQKVSLPLRWVLIASTLAAAVFFWFGRRKLALVVVAALALEAFVPRIVSAVYVRPNELALERPYIMRHIEATRQAFGLTERTSEVEFEAKLAAPIDISRNKPLLDNIRLWDWRAFHDTVTQIQALRPYYVFADSDVDRYIIDGQLRQVLLSPRELDIRQVADVRARWVNSHFIYTHGYGLVMAEANRITQDGLPVLFIKDAPPQLISESLKLTRPELYFGEVVHEPVYVRTDQPEFNYPAGADNVHSRYEGSGGFPISSLPLRAMAALTQGDINILLTGMLSRDSRMMIRRRVSDRVRELAGFIAWDPDPYLVLTAEGRLVWIIDGYTTSRAHPYSRSISLQAIGTVNYIRNSVKAVVDAYDGTATLYIFDPRDPIIQAYQRLFPDLFQPSSNMPDHLRQHARYPEIIFRAQAEIYRTYHMTDPEAFYNKEDLWDLARNIYGQSSRPEPVTPTYVVATLPGEQQPEFLLIIPFTPRNKDNLIGLMVARCDGPHLGELVFLQLSKQALIFGPMQIEARINQDQNISKDLTLWNQQGSQVLRGQMLVLPIDNTFLYVEPIYIQAAEARMPQLRKVAMAVGNSLIYTDTYEQAVAQLSALKEGAAPVEAAAAKPAPGAPAAAAVAPGQQMDTRIEAVRQHLRRYRELSSQGRWAEAGKELEALDALVRER